MQMLRHFERIDKMIAVGDAMLSLCSIKLENKHEECQNRLKYANGESHYMQTERKNARVHLHKGVQRKKTWLNWIQEIFLIER